LALTECLARIDSTLGRSSPETGMGILRQPMVLGLAVKTRTVSSPSIGVHVYSPTSTQQDSSPAIDEAGRSEFCGAQKDARPQSGHNAADNNNQFLPAPGWKTGAAY
jgi:hypothetical protein